MGDKEIYEVGLRSSKLCGDEWSRRDVLEFLE